MKLTIEIDEADAAKIATVYKSGVVYHDCHNQALHAVANAWREQRPRPLVKGDRVKISRRDVEYFGVMGDPLESRVLVKWDTGSINSTYVAELVRVEEA